jgi:hypothetical protein
VLYRFYGGAERRYPVSIYGYLNCHDCTVRCGPHWRQERAPALEARSTNQVLWKFLADHCGHRIDVRLEHEMTEEMFGYQEIGGDRDNDVSFETYLAGWPGLGSPNKG